MEDESGENCVPWACALMCRDRRFETCAGMCVSMGVDAFVEVCVEICTATRQGMQMCVRDTCVGFFKGTCVDVCRHVYVDMCI